MAASKDNMITVSFDDLQKMIADAVNAKMAEASQAERVYELTPEAKAANDKANEEIEIELFYDGQKYKDPVQVGLNGKMWLIKRGERVKVPAAIAEILENSRNQDRIATNTVREYEKKLEEIQ